MKITNKFIGTCFFALFISQSFAQDNISKVWVADTGDGTYRNPVIHADYSDPDVCRVGDDYYMTSSSFNCVPGLPILHSKDLVNWTLIGHALEKLVPEDVFSKPQHGNGVWAPSIRHHNGEFYIYWGDPDYGIYMVKTQTPSGNWEQPVLVKAGKGLIDSCPLWDAQGRAWLVHAFAGSRAGFKSVLAVAPLSADGTKVTGESRLVFDGHEGNKTIEGPKFYQHNGYYYIFAPAGGVATGWQLALRSKSPYGPYEKKIVLSQGNSTVNGPHQGAWVDTPTGDNWFLHFQDKAMYGRVVHLQPMVWKNDWPVIGNDPDGDGCGEPVMSYRKPVVKSTSKSIATPADSDEFNSLSLGLQWQWQANYNPLWYYCASDESLLRLYSVPSVNVTNLWESPNLLLQKLPAEEFKATAKLVFKPKSDIKGERAGIVLMGLDYSTLYLEKTEEGIRLVQADCMKADKASPELVNQSVAIGNNPVYLRIEVKKGGVSVFSYSLDNKRFNALGKTFTAKEGKWIGAKIGLYCNRPVLKNDGGWVDIDWFRITI